MGWFLRLQSRFMMLLLLALSLFYTHTGLAKPRYAGIAAYPGYVLLHTCIFLFIFCR